MTNLTQLNNIEHKDLCVKRRYAAEYGDNIGAVVISPTEYSDIQREYPIVFRRDADSKNFQAMAMLGLVPDENLFLQSGGLGWSGHYVPAALARGPFSIGYEDQTSLGGETRAPVIYINMDDPRVNAEGGKPVFMPYGGNTPYLDAVAHTLQGFHDGLGFEKAMFSMFYEAGLIEPMAMDIELVNGDKLRVEGHYTINEERLLSLSPDQLFELNSARFLQGAFLILNSLNNVNRLIELKNARISNA